MECPRCSGVEMEDLETESGSVLGQCPDCHSLWLDSGDLTRILLRHNLPGLESLGGRPNLGEAAGMCPEDLTDLVVVESPGNHGRAYAMCEVCGGVWIGEEFESESTEDLLEKVIAFFRSFGPSQAHA